MAIVLVGQAGLNGSTVGSPQTITYSSTGGNTLIMVGHLYDLGNNVYVAPTSITDTASNTWQVSANSTQAAFTAQNPPTSSLLDPDDGATNHQSEWVAWCVGASHVTSVTLAWEGAQTSFARVAVAEFSGINQFDNSWAGGSATAGAASSVSASLTVNVTGELAVGAVDFGGGGTPSIPAGWTGFTSSGGQCAYLIGPSVGAFSPAWADTVAGCYTGVAALFSPVALGAAVTYSRPRYVIAAAPSPVPWEQRPYRSVPGAVDTPANPLVTPLDSAWQANGQYSHLYADDALRDRRQYFTQRLYISNPSLLATAELENELLGGGDYTRQYTPALYYDRREVPQQPARLADPLLIQTAELENELLGGAETPKYYRTPASHTARWWMPQQPPRLADPLLIATAELENELLGGAQTWAHYITSAYIDRREVPQQRLYISDPSFYPTGAVTDPLTVAWGAGGPYWHLYNRAADIGDRREYFTQRLYQSDPLLLLSALLENELLGGAETPKYYRTAATHYDRRLVPQQRAYYDVTLLATAELENELLGGGDTARYYLTACYWDRREVPQQRAYISDPSFYPTGAVTDPLTVAWGAGGNYWHLYNRAADATDRREVPQQRAYVSDPLLLTTAELENELLGGAQTWAHYVTAAYYDRRLVPQQRPYGYDPNLLLGPLDPTLAAWADLAARYRQAATHYDRRLYPQQRLYWPVPAPPPPFTIGLLTAGTAPGSTLTAGDAALAVLTAATAAASGTPTTGP